MEWAEYDEWMADEIVLCMQKIKELADSFSFWQRIKYTGRPTVAHYYPLLYQRYYDLYSRLLSLQRAHPPEISSAPSPFYITMTSSSERGDPLINPCRAPYPWPNDET
ncbi:MAG: hypothetical protein R6V01_08995 [Thermoplasmatota archaeon]